MSRFGAGPTSTATSIHPNMLKLNCNVLLKDMFEKAEQSGESFYRYNAVTANCQRFISVLGLLMQAGGITGTDNFCYAGCHTINKKFGT